MMPFSDEDLQAPVSSIIKNKIAPMLARDGGAIELLDIKNAKVFVQLKGACVEFEAMFLNLMYGEMRKSVNEQDGLLPKTQAEKIMQSMLDEELTKNMAKAGGVGLADVLYKQLSFEESSKKNKNTIDTRL